MGLSQFATQYGPAVYNLRCGPVPSQPYGRAGTAVTGVKGDKELSFSSINSLNMYGVSHYKSLSLLKTFQKWI